MSSLAQYERRLIEGVGMVCFKPPTFAYVDPYAGGSRQKVEFYSKVLLPRNFCGNSNKVFINIINSHPPRTFYFALKENAAFEVKGAFDFEEEIVKCKIFVSVIRDGLSEKILVSGTRAAVPKAPPRILLEHTERQGEDEGESALQDEEVPVGAAETRLFLLDEDEEEAGIAVVDTEESLGAAYQWGRGDQQLTENAGGGAEREGGGIQGWGEGAASFDGAEHGEAQEGEDFHFDGEEEGEADQPLYEEHCTGDKDSPMEVEEGGGLRTFNENFQLRLVFPDCPQSTELLETYTKRDDTKHQKPVEGLRSLARAFVERRLEGTGSVTTVPKFSHEGKQRKHVRVGRLQEPLREGLLCQRFRSHHGWCQVLVVAMKVKVENLSDESERFVRARLSSHDPGNRVYRYGEAKMRAGFEDLWTHVAQEDYAQKLKECEEAIEIRPFSTPHPMHVEILCDQASGSAGRT